MEDKLGIQLAMGRRRHPVRGARAAPRGTKGLVRVEASAVHVEVDLPFLLRAMKGMVESKVNDKLDAVLGKA